jgi:hypothetical protein
MPKKHGAKQQKKIAKQKAKRTAKRSLLQQRTSNDPTVRLQQAERWPIVRAVMAAELWKQGIGSLLIAREESEGWLVFGVFLVDVYCLGVKNAFWKAGGLKELEELLQRMDESQEMVPIEPTCLVKIVTGAVDYAHSFGFAPHHDYRHAALLFEGIDPATCPKEFTFGKDGKPFYVQGPNESPAQAEAIMRRIVAAGGHYLIEAPADVLGGLLHIDDDELEDLEDFDEDDDEEESD